MKFSRGAAARFRVVLITLLRWRSTGESFTLAPLRWRGGTWVSRSLRVAKGDFQLLKLLGLEVRPQAMKAWDRAGVMHGGTNSISTTKRSVGVEIRCSCKILLCV